MKLFCPSCGAAVEFRYDDSFVRVCAACRSAIVRTDRGIDSFGQFADLAPTSSGLQLGERGQFQGTSFTLEGRALYRHAAGGSWEEWYLKLADGRWAWLGQDQGQWVITFRRAASDQLPPFERLTPGAEVALGGAPPRRLTVAECNSSSLIGAEGELPFTFTPGASSRYADLADGQGRFATIDYGAPGEQPVLYLGQRVPLAALGLEVQSDADIRLPAETGKSLACPNCGGSLALRVPGGSLCVACPYCGSLLDCEGELRILGKSDELSPPSAIPLGAQAMFEGVRYVVTGRLRREASYEDAPPFTWDEYLLYAPEAGYRWLSCAKGHYTFLCPLPAGAVKQGAYDQVIYDGMRFALFDRAETRVCGVWGEFYWKVQVGEKVFARDYIAPPALLSCENSASEIHWTFGLYQSPEQIQVAFGMKQLSDERSGVGGNQPFPHRGWLGMAAVLGVLFFLCTLLRMGMVDNQRLHQQSYTLAESTRVKQTDDLAGWTAGNALYMFFTPEFELSEADNLEVSFDLPLNNSWAYFTVDLIHDASGELRTFGRELSYYHGVDGGESWSEGSRSFSHVFGAGRAGQHLLRIEVQTPAPLQAYLSVHVTRGVLPWDQFGVALLALGAPALLLLLYQWMFERSRWSESDFTPAYYGGGSSD